MNTYREQLEGTELFRIRRLRRFTVLLLVTLAIALSAYGMIVEGASLRPLYLPIGPFLSVGFVMLLVASAANLVLRSLEIRNARRDSQRYLIVRNSMRRAVSVLVVSLVLGIVLLVPWTHQVANASLRTLYGGRVDSLESVSYGFTNQDVFGLARFAEGRLLVEGPGNRDLIVTLRENGQQLDSRIASPGLPFEFPISPSAKTVNQYELVIENTENQPVGYQVVVERRLTPELGTIVPGVLLVLAGLNGTWYAYARPLRRKYEASSIYSVKYVEEAVAGERTYADYYRMRAPTAVGPNAPAPMIPAARPVPLPPPPVPIVPALGRSEPTPPRTVGPAPEGLEPERTHAELMEEGSRLFTEGRYEPALARFDEALEMEPQNAQALLSGALALLRLGRKEEALGAYDRALELDPRNPKAFSGKAQAFEADAQWALAAESWAEYLHVVPGDIDARLRRAETILNTGDRAAAVKALEEALFLAPSDPRIRARIESLTVNVPAVLSRALVASASGRTADALADFEQILAADPDNVNALVGKGVAFRRGGQPDRALETFEVALSKQPGNSAALRAKGAILEEKGDFDGALDVYDDLLAWNPRDPEVWALQGSVLERLGEPEEALASYHEALKLDPNNPEWRARAIALESSRKGQEQFLEELFTIKGVGPARVRALLAAGYKTADSIRDATEDELASVNGMTRAIARDLFRHFHPGPPSPGPEPPPPPPA